jgi:serine/threonine-protein kinase
MPRYFYIVMEYVDGRDLSEVCAANGLEPMLAARITQDVLEVLDNAHNFSTTLDGRSIRGVVHGDLKPRNIRLTPAGEVKVLDFGIAKALSLTRNFTQNVFGSVQYSSPQRLLTGEVDAGADLWAGGVMLYEMLAGHPYFQAENGSRLEHMIRSYDRVLPLPEAWPQSLRNILRHALHPDVRVRYQTAAEFAQDLQAFRNGQAVSAPADGEGTRRVALNDDETRRTSRPACRRSTGASAPQAECDARDYAHAGRIGPRGLAFPCLSAGERVPCLGERSPAGAGPVQREAAESGCCLEGIPEAVIAFSLPNQLVGRSRRVAETPGRRCR